VAESEFQFRPLNFIQKLRDDVEKFFWLLEPLANERSLHMPEKPEV
jgi:hypothetical protein